METDALTAAIESLHQETFAARLANLARSALDFDHALVLAYRDKEPPLLLYKDYANAAAERTIPEYMTAAYMMDPIYEAHLAQVPAGLYRLSDLAPDRFRSTAYYRSYYKETGNSDELVLLVQTASGYTVALSLLLSGGRRFGKAAVAALTAIAPPCCALMRQQWQNLATSHPPTEGAANDPLAPRIRSAIERQHGVTLTERQAEIVAMILRGHSSHSIGLNLGISPQTVKTHRRNLYTRLRVATQSQLFALVIGAIGPLTPSPN